jgi:uncharacterized protein DUF5666
MMRRTISSLIVAAAIVAAACGGKSTSPTAPSTNAGADASTSPNSPAGPAEPSGGGSTAEVKGVVDTVPPTTPALTFKIGGKVVVTTASTTFRDGPTNTFADIKVGVTIEAKGSMSGDTLTAVDVEIKAAAAPAPNPAPTPGPNPGPNPAPKQVELKGAVAGLTGTAASFTFTVNGTMVKGDNTTVFKAGDADVSDHGGSSSTATFADLKNGANVEVKGTQNTDGSVQAQTIEVEENEVENEAEVKGTVAGLTGTASSFTFTVNGTTVKGDSKTVFRAEDADVSDHGGSSGTATFADLKNGAQVEVKGTRNTDGSIQAQTIQIEENENEQEEVEMQGTLGAVTGTCPAISSTVNGTKFTASASTRFDNPCSGFASGNKVEVRGTRNTDGSLNATRLRQR